jgi:hypothetical protein
MPLIFAKIDSEPKNLTQKIGLSPKKLEKPIEIKGGGY